MGDLSAFGTVLAQLFLAATAMVFIFMIVVSLLAVHLVRRVFRSSAVKKANLTVKAQCTMPGPRRDLAQLRLRLHRAVASAKTASSLLQANGGPKGDLPSLVRRLERVAASVDAQLRVMECEPDDTLLREMLVPARARMDELIGIVHAIQKCAVNAMGADTYCTLADLARDAHNEVEAIDAGLESLHQLSSGDRLNSWPEWTKARTRPQEAASYR